jgi:hypothetical protein
MAFNTSKTHVAGTAAEAADLNQNTAEIEAELNAFPTDGSLKAGAVQFSNIDSGVIETSSEGLTSTDTALPTSKAVDEHIDTKIAAIPGFPDGVYTGQESITFPNGLIIKWKYATANPSTVFTYATPFPNAVNGVVCGKYNTDGGIPRCVALSKTSATFSNSLIANGNNFWIIWGY